MVLLNGRKRKGKWAQDPGVNAEVSVKPMVTCFGVTKRGFGVMVISLLIAASGFSGPPFIGVAPDTVIEPSKDTPDNQGPMSPNRVLPGEKLTRKSYLIPALEIPAFIFLLNRFNYFFIEPTQDFDVSYASTRDHIQHGPWGVDQDDFAVNQIGHPYQGAIYFGFARSAGLNYWESLLYANAGSVAWELAGETSDPSINDQVASGTAGSFVGEALYRLANLVLEEGGPNPSGWRIVGASFISPPMMLNRTLFGDRYGPVLASRHPAIFSRLQLGAGFNTSRNAAGSSATLSPMTGYGNFMLAYGLPGKPGYRYIRPFDYFDFEIDSISEKGTQYNSAMIRGLLFGAPYEGGDNYRGIWGLYGSFDYVAPQVYRLSTTAVSLGTTGQWWCSKHIALQGTALAGIGFGSVGTILPDNSEADFHYGVTPQQQLALRLIMGKRAMLDVSGRNYFISGTGANKAPGKESIQHVSSSFAVRIFGHHAVSIGYLVARRNAFYDGDLPNRHQLVRTVTVAYNFLGRPNFGAVEWGENRDDH